MLLWKFLFLLLVASPLAKNCKQNILTCRLGLINTRIIALGHTTARRTGQRMLVGNYTVKFRFFACNDQAIIAGTIHRKNGWSISQQIHTLIRQFF